MERMELWRIQHNENARGVFHPSHIDFSTNLSTHDSLHVIWKGVVHIKRTRKEIRVLVIIDIRKVFNNVPQKSVIEKMQVQGFHGRQIDFVKIFLR